MARRKLTDKQRAFVLEYPKDFNATQAAIRAKYSEKTAAMIGSENLTKPYILEAIEIEYKKRAISVDEILHRLVAMARGEEPTKVIKKSDGEVIETFERRAALELLGKYHALFTERIKVEDWRYEIIQLIRDGELEYEDVKEELGSDLATELFESSGISIGQTGKAEAESTD